MVNKILDFPFSFDLQVSFSSDSSAKIAYDVFFSDFYKDFSRSVIKAKLLNSSLSINIRAKDRVALKASSGSLVKFLYLLNSLEVF